MRKGIEIEVTAADRARLEAIVADRNSPQKHVWRAHGLRPHQVRSFKLSTDPKFAAKVEDVVGLYVDPPAHAVVLSIDEKSHVWMAPGSQEKS